MKAFCTALNEDNVKLAIFGVGDTPEECARDAVKTWVDEGELLYVDGNGEWQTVEVHVENHGIYLVGILLEMRISKAQKKEGGDA